MNILITGVTGTFSKSFLSFIDKNKIKCKILGISRDEQKQKSLPKYNFLTTALGDVRDYSCMVSMCRDIDIIIHTAALKCIDVIEDNPLEAIKTNIVGTSNIYDASIINNVKKVVFISTDKAVYPINTYGMTKAIGEKIILQNENNIVCRYGNIIGSRGSVIPLFINSLLNKKEVDITDLNMTRFWWDVNDAANLIYKLIEEDYKGLYIPQLKAAPITFLVSCIAEILKIDKYKINEIGIRKGEKLHETLTTFEEGGELFSSDDFLQYNREELIKELRKYIGNNN